MTQTQIMAYLVSKVGITRRQAKSMLDELNKLVTRQLKKEGSLRLAGLGVFHKRKLKPRVGRNPIQPRASRSRFQRGPVCASRRPRRSKTLCSCAPPG